MTINNNKTKYVRYDISGIMDSELKQQTSKFERINMDMVHNKHISNVSMKMAEIVLFLKEHINEVDISLIESSNDENDDVEHIETQYFMLFLSTNNDSSVLHVQFKIDLDVNICARIGLLLSSFYNNEVINGFSFLDPYIIVQMKDGQLKYLYGEEAKEALENITFETKHINKFKEHFTDKFLDNIKIDDLSSC